MATAALMIIAFLLLTGGALLYVNLLKMNIGEGMVLSASTLIALVLISGKLIGKISPGRYLFILLGLAGIGLTIYRLVRKTFDMSLLTSLYWPVLAAVFLLGILLFAGDIIQYIDEFHMWAAAPKYMLENNKLPIYNDFIGDTIHNIGTSAFHYYFQSFTGFNEGMLYASGFLLFWIGFLLPVSNLGGKYWKETIIYVVILYFSMFSLYSYGSKNIMVDLPVAGWAGGLAGWSLRRKRKKQNLLLFAAVFIMIYSFKGWAGPMLSVFVTGLILFDILISRREDSDNLVRALTGLFCASLGLVSFVVVSFFRSLLRHDLNDVFLGSFLSKIATGRYSQDKVQKTVADFLIRVTGRGLAETKSYLKISFITGILLCLLIIYISGHIYERRKVSRLYIIYFMNCAVVYAAVVLFGYVFRISYHEAIRTSGGARYLSIFVMFLFIFSLSMLFFTAKRPKDGKRIPYLVGLFLVPVFVYGIQYHFLTDNTAWNKKQIYKYQTIIEQRDQVGMIRDAVGTEDKVYFLNQESTKLDEFGNNPALFYMGSQMSNPRLLPWKFTKSGCILRIDDNSDYKLKDFPGILSSGGYSYVWIYKTDDYLNQYLPHIIEMPAISFAETSKPAKNLIISPADKSADKTAADPTPSGKVADKDDMNPAGILDGQLYKVIYDESGGVKRLELVQNLKPYDNRRDHELQG